MASILWDYTEYVVVPTIIAPRVWPSREWVKNHEILGSNSSYRVKNTRWFLPIYVNFGEQSYLVSVASRRWQVSWGISRYARKLEKVFLVFFLIVVFGKLSYLWKDPILTAGYSGFNTYYWLLRPIPPRRWHRGHWTPTSRRLPHTFLGERLVIVKGNYTYLPWDFKYYTNKPLPSIFVC